MLVLGASDNLNRTSYSAIKLLLNRGLQVSAIGQKKGNVDSIQVHEEISSVTSADVVSIFIFREKAKEVL